MSIAMTLRTYNARFSVKMMVTLICVAIADFLFYEENMGWTIGLFGGILCSVLLFFRQDNKVNKTSQIIAISALFQSLLLVEQFSVLSVILLAVSILLLSISRTSDPFMIKRGIFRYFIQFLCFPFILSDYYKAIRRKVPASNGLSFLSGWLLPIIATMVFAILIINSNLLLLNEFEKFDFTSFFMNFSFKHMSFWFFTAALITALIKLKIKTKHKEERKPLLSFLYTKQSITRSLVAFNILFFIQTALDFLYLWNGTALPDGLTYADYAHKGAYPLILTALLAGYFVIIAYRSDESAMKNDFIKRLLYAWIGQNILLVLSSIFRTVLYIESYSLTYLRVAALIWMVMVCAGLIILILRIKLSKSENWMMKNIMVTAFSMLFIASVPNYPNLVAEYNYENSKQKSGSGVNVDIIYLQCLGPDVIPVLLKISNDPDFSQFNRQIARKYADALFYELRSDVNNWRTWTFSRHRMLHKLETSEYILKIQNRNHLPAWEIE